MLKVYDLLHVIVWGLATIGFGTRYTGLERNFDLDFVLIFYLEYTGTKV